MKSNLFVIVYICSIYLIFTDAQNIRIDGDNPLTADGGKNLVLTCEVFTGTADGEDPRLEWYDQRGMKVESSGRKSVLMIDNKRLKLLINNVEEDDAGTYNCTGNINGKLESAHVVVKTKMPLVVTEEQAPRTQYFTEGTDAKIKCNPQGQVTVTWKGRNDESITSTSDRYNIQVGYLEIPSVNRSDDGTYKCLVFAGTEYKDIRIEVIITVPPKIVKAPASQSIAVGDPARFECVATAKPDPVYFWYKDNGGVELGGERYNISQQTGVFIIKSVIKDDEGSYKCVAKSRENTDEKTAVLTVLIPPSIVTLDNSTADEDTQAKLQCTAHGDPIPQIVWQKQGSQNDYTDGTQQDNTNIVVSSQQRVDLMQVIGSLTISNVRANEAGWYLCKATNEARTEQKATYLTIQYKPNFSKVKSTVIYSWGGQSTGMPCIASSVPTANITWFKGDKQITQGDQYYSIQQVTVGDDTTSTLTVEVDFANENRVFGEDYVCKAGNKIGENTKNFTLRRADKPSAPGCSILETTPTTIKIEVTVPVIMNGPPVSSIEVEYNGNTQNYPVVGQSKIEVLLEGLTPNTGYSINVAAKNDVGTGSPLMLPITTLAPRAPYPIIIHSRPLGIYPVKFDLQWKPVNNGGFPITEINVRYREVEVFPNKTADNKFQKKRELSGWYPTQKVNSDATAYQLKGLAPQKYYEVEVTAVNTKGTSDPEAFIFKTSADEPETTTGIRIPPSKKSQDSDSDDAVPLGLIIAIIIIIVIILFIVIDVTCYYKRKCGVFMCIKERVGRTGSMETRSKEKIIEEGDADGKIKLKETSLNGQKSVVDKETNVSDTNKAENGKTIPQKDEKEDTKSDNTAKESKKESKNANLPVEKANQKKKTGDEQEPTKQKLDEKQKTNSTKETTQNKNNKDKTEDKPSTDNPENTSKVPVTSQTEITEETKSAKKKLDFKDIPDADEDKKVPLLGDKDQEGTEADQEAVEAEEAVEEKEPEDKEEKPETPTKDAEEAEEVKPEEKEKPESPKEESKDVTAENKE